MQNPRVLVVEDKPDIREMRAELLARQGYMVEVAGGVDEALTLFRRAPFPVVVTDLQMEGLEDGLEVAREIRAVNPETKVIIITGADHRKAAVDGYRVNVFAYVEKGQRRGRDSLREAIGRAFEEIQEQKVRKYMLSFLTHTMRNTFAGAEPALKQALEKSGALASKLNDNRNVYQMISNLAFLRTSLATVDSMLEAYKLLVREPENLRRAWESDRGGDASLRDVLDAAIGAALSRLFCQEAQIPTLKRLAASFSKNDRRTLKQQYLSDNLLIEEEIRVPPADWLATIGFGILTVDGEPPETRLNKSGIRFSLIFAVLSELCFNAIKYSDGEEPVRIEWQTRKENHELKIVNTCSSESTSQVGSQEGKNFIGTLLNPLDGIAVDYVEAEDDQGLHEAKLTISKTLLNGDHD